MHEIENEAVGRETPSGKTGWPFALLTACLPVMWACSQTVTGPSAAPVMSLAGTWREGTTAESRVWRLTQVWDTINGSSRIVSSGWTGGDGRVVGTLSGSSFGF